MDIALVIAQNLATWMDASANLGTLKALSRASGVGFGTVQRARNGDGNITAQNLEALARAFKRSAADLLTLSDVPYPPAPPIHSPAAEEPSTDEREVLQGYRDASPEFREVMRIVARDATRKRQA
jgi:transcriptional regulator with XRE-family HTH domain